MMTVFSKSTKSVLISLVFMGGFLAAAYFLQGNIHKNPLQMIGRASFGSGVIHGALMPLAWVPILAGQNIPIYEVYNTGRAYHLGYILGVNLCGFVFIPPMVRAFRFFLDRGCGRRK